MNMSNAKFAIALMCAFMLAACAVGDASAGDLHYASAPQYLMNGPTLMAASSLPLALTSWEGIAVIAVLLIIAIAAIVYMLAGATGSATARTWSKMQIYEAFVSILLIGIFGALSYMFFLNPQGAFAGAGLLPGNVITHTGCYASNVNNIYNLSACDMGAFMVNATNYFATIYYVGFIAAATVPGVIINATPFTVIGQGTVSFQLGTPSFLPSSLESMFETGASGLLFLILLNQIQMILISGSLLFLSLFMVLGLVARCFGFTRTFGGSLIALGLGLGLVYPMLISMTYGFIDVQLQSASWVTLAGAIFSTLYTMVLGTGVSCTVNVAQAAVQSSTCGYLDTAVLTTGYLIVGLLIIPLLNFAILDAFIVDFSRAMGERVDFMSMIGSVI